MSDHDRIAKLERKLEKVSADLDAALIALSILLLKEEPSARNNEVYLSLMDSLAAQDKQLERTKTFVARRNSSLKNLVGAMKIKH